MKHETKNYDIIIIGGGAAGMMAAISARRHHKHAKIAIIDRTFALGRKLLVCGAGRCNITNVNLKDSVTDHYYGAPDYFIKGVFDQFGFEDMITFFEEMGIEMYVERKTSIGKMFPVTNQAHTVTELMLDEIERGGIDVYYETNVDRIEYGELKIETDKDDSESSIFNFQLFTSSNSRKKDKSSRNLTFLAHNLILSAGGKTYPSFGSNGSGYDLAAKFGHKVIDPIPSALSLEAKSQLSHFLHGQKMEMEVTSIINGKEIKTSIDDVMFKKYGISGPAILNISREISIHLNREGRDKAKVRLNFFPSKSKKEVQELLEERWNARPEQILEKSLYGIFPNKIARKIVETINLDPGKKVSRLTKSEIVKIVNRLTDTQLDIIATRGWNEAEFTAGGIDTSDVNLNTLESYLSPGLYLAGEILNVDGDVGGFNLSWSWASGFVAGKVG